MRQDEAANRPTGYQGIRGATTVEKNDAQTLLTATRELLEQIIAANSLHSNDVMYALFTATADLDAAYPARAAREMGWVKVPLMCAQEMQVEGGLQRCVRVLVFARMDRDVHHVYLKEARDLRPDWAEEGQR